MGNGSSWPKASHSCHQGRGLEVPYQAKPYFLKVWALQAKVAESSGDFAPILKTDMQVRRALSRILTSI